MNLPDSFNAAEHFVTRNRGRGARPAYLYEGGTLSFEDVFDLSRRAATFLRTERADAEQRIALFLDDSPELVVSFWGSIWAGCAAVLINRACTDDDVGYILRDSRARVLVTDRAGAARISKSTFADLQHIVVVDEGCPFLMTLGAQAPMARPAPTHRDEPAFWLYTSGSTGRPKGVVHAHGSMPFCAENYARKTLGLNENDISFSVAKIPFAYGHGATLYMPMWVGAPAVLTAAGNVFDIAAVLKRFKPTVFWGIPTIYSGMLAAADICDFRLESVRLCVSAAESLPESVFQGFKARFGQEICEGIGTTELLHVFLSNEPGAVRAGTCGRPVPGYDVRVLSEDGKTAAPGHAGDLEVRGPSLMLGYWNRRAETLRALYAGAMRTGDKYVMDEDGYFRFMGRTDDLFKVNGQWVAPSEVESVLRGHEAVAECAVVLERVEDSEFPSVIAYVTVREAHAGTAAAAVEESIRKYARAKLAHFKAPKRVRVVEEIPRTVSGKMDRKSLVRADAANGGTEGKNGK